MELYITVQTKNTLTFQVNHMAGVALSEIESAVAEFVSAHKPDGSEFEVVSSKRRGHFSDAAAVGTTVRLRRKDTPPTKKRPYVAPLC